MGIMNVDALKEGMVLSNDIIDPSGRCLMTKETQLTLKHIRVLKMRGITEVGIKGTPDKTEQITSAPSSDNKEKMLQEVAQIIKKKFLYHNLKNEIIQELFKQCVIQKLEQVQEEKSLKAPVLKKDIDLTIDKNVDIKKLKINETELYKKVDDLPTLPTIFYKLNEVINDPRSSSSDIANVISKDASLSTKILKLANSAFYGLKSKIDSISRAVVSLGTREIGTLAVGLTFVSYFKEIPNEIVDMESFWKHSIGCAIAARTIAGIKNIPNSERFFISGLIHDVGRLVLFKYHPVGAKVAIIVARQKNLFLIEAEEAVLGVKHTTIGKTLLKKWKLPMSIENMVAYHHQPGKSQDVQEPAIINIADMIVNAMDVGTSGEYLVPALDLEAWKALGLSKSIFETTTKQVNRQLKEIIRFFIHEK